MGPESGGEREISRISLNAEREYLGAVLAFLREATGRLGLGEADVKGLEHAVEEVCVNVFERGFGPVQAAGLDVVLLRRPGHVVVAVEDQGLPFDFMSLEAGAGTGLAAPSLSHFADAVRFVNVRIRGNRVEIVISSAPLPTRRTPRIPFPDAYSQCGVDELGSLSVSDWIHHRRLAERVEPARSFCLTRFRNRRSHALAISSNSVCASRASPAMLVSWR